MSNEQTGALSSDIAVDVKALITGTTTTKNHGVAKDSGNTDKTLVNPEKIREAVQDTVDYFEKIARENQFNLKFSIDDKSNTVIVQVIEKNSGKLIRQIPPQEILKLRQRISDLLGMIYDKEM
ncbi:MAG: flagellar protein FlaG [candidate division Zixibacteria bacterium]|jgi:flagellar protein FlaG|nr:flagellar protein FlaG [candidate division Zixibacteria bacterium]